MPEETIISDYSPDVPRFRVTREGNYTIIRDYSTNAPRFKIEGAIGGGSVKTMTTAERTAITPEAGQLIYDTDEDVLYLGDGVTPGGNALGGSGDGDYIAGPGIDITSGVTISRAAYGTIETVDVSGASPSVTMVPGHAYSINATTKAVTLNVASFNANQFGIDEGHLEIFVAGTGYVVTGTNVELANALEPDAINYCTVRFVGGIAKIALEDNIGGYVVVSAVGSTAGTLPYALSSASQEYVAFDASLNGTTLDMGGSTASGEKHLVGNGYTETTLTGNIDCGTSKFTVANLALQNVVVNGGTMTLGDVYIPSGSTVSVSGGGLAIEKVTGDGGTIDLGGTNVNISSRATASASGCIFTGGSSSFGGAFQVSSGSIMLVDCVVSGNSATTRGGGIRIDSSVNGYTVNLSNTVLSGNSAGNGTVVGQDIVAYHGAIVNINGGCTIGDIGLSDSSGASAFVNINGVNSIERIAFAIGSGTVTISSGAVLDLRNAVRDAIVPGGDVLIDGGCQVITSAGTTVSIAGGTYSKINNDGTTE